MRGSVRFVAVAGCIIAVVAGYALTGGAQDPPRPAEGRGLLERVAELEKLNQRIKDLEARLDQFKVKDVKFFPVGVGPGLKKDPVVPHEFEFPEPVDTVALCGLGNDTHDTVQCVFTKIDDGKRWSVRFVGARGPNVNWIPTAHVLGIKLVR